MEPRIVDTSLTGYTSGSVDRQDDLYRNRPRPQPYPLVQHDSGYQSATLLGHSSLSASSSPFLLGLANSVKFSGLLNNESNFASKTVVDCYQSNRNSVKWQRLDEEAFHECLQSLTLADHDQPDHRILLFFSTLDFAEGATYKARSSFSKVAIEAFLSQCNLNLLFVPDLLGRPNYWSPQLYSGSGSGGALESIEFFCQQPRFVIHSPGFKQRSPVSIYMRYDVTRNLTYYIISAPEAEESIKSFKNILDLAARDGPENISNRALVQHPLEVHIMLAQILCESSQGYINFFRQSMFAQLRAVDELTVQETTANRKALADVTIELQIVSKDVNKLITDVDVASRNLARTQETFDRLDQQHAYATCTLPPAYNTHRQQLVDTLQYLVSSMDKQKMWLHNYRDRKDIAMSLVFNLVTQQDAANNIGISKAMKQDSSSMNGIALLTMVFLPGTFTSTLLSAGLFSSFARHREIHVSGLWWFWAAITFPLTGVVLLLWGVLCWRKKFQTWWTREVMAKNGLGKVNGANKDVEGKV